MIINIKIEGDLKFLPKLQKKIGFCAAIALTKSAQAVQADLQSKTLAQVFDRPNNFTLRGMVVQRATPQKLQATVGFKARQEKYLSAEVHGGQRRTKAYERALTAAGLLPQGYVTVPGEKAPIDAYGGIPRAFLVAMLRQLTDGGYGGASKGDAKKQTRAYRKHGGFMVVPVGNRAGFDSSKIKQPGIYRVTQMADGRWDLDPMLIFVRRASYKPRLDLLKVAEPVVEATFKAEFMKALES